MSQPVRLGPLSLRRTLYLELGVLDVLDVFLLPVFI